MLPELIATLLPYVAGAGPILGAIAAWYLSVQKNKSESAKNEAESRNRTLELQIEQNRVELEERKQDFTELMEARAAYKDLNETMRKNFDADMLRVEKRLERHAIQHELEIKELKQDGERRQLVIDELKKSERNCHKELREIKEKLNLT